jgi:DNA-binding beta-propeller fold protein YncE
VLVLNPETGAELARIASAQGTDNLWFDPAARALYASAADGSISIIQANNNQFSQVEQPTEVRGHTFAVDSDRNYVYVAGGREGRSKLVILRRGAVPANDVQNAKKPQPAQAQQEAKQPPPSKPLLQNSVQPIPGNQLVKLP